MLTNHFLSRRLLLLFGWMAFLTAVVSTTAVLGFVPTDPSRAPQLCVDGTAGDYPCRSVDLLAHLPLSQMGGDADSRGSDHWGWHDADTGRDFVLFTQTDGTAFIEITDPAAPRYLGKMPPYNPGDQSIWWDVKVYDHYAYVTADITSTNGLQIVDLHQLRTITTPTTISATAHYDGFGAAHNQWINPATASLYVFRPGGDSCNAGVHMLDLTTPLSPTFAGCLDSGQAPLSDGECLIYNGPDDDYTGRELCFIGSDDNAAIADVTDKQNVEIVADFTYPGIVRAHQGFVTADHAYWLISDTMDEMMNGHNTRTYVIDISDIDNPVPIGFHEHDTTVRDHNMYRHGSFVYQSNWRGGLRVLHLGPVADARLVEMAYFDTDPNSDSVANTSAWTAYPYWKDGVVTVSTKEDGLFVLRVDIPTVHMPAVLGR